MTLAHHVEQASEQNPRLGDKPLELGRLDLFVFIVFGILLGNDFCPISTPTPRFEENA